MCSALIFAMLARGDRRLTLSWGRLVVHENDVGYFRRRALQEQVAAQRATCEAARLRHDELAAMYRFRTAMLSKPVEWADALADEPTAEVVKLRCSSPTPAIA